MAFTCGFFNSENGDRKYNAEQMSAIFDGIIADGVFTTIGDHMAVSAGTGMQVLVGTGKAWFDHTWNVNDAAYPLAIAASDVTLSRIDAIVLETNHSDSVRLNKLRVVQGTVASSPVKPTLTNSEKVHQHPLAWVTVAPGVTQIAASAIENAVGTSACPFVTGIIATTAIDDLFNQWNGEFDEWFDNLKAQLSDNVVANLQRQIDARVKIADKATPADVEQGINDSKWVTPKGLKDGNVAYRVGDVLTTARTNLGDKWALCNGASVNRASFPELSDLFPTTPDGTWNVTTVGGSNTSMTDIIYVNGYWIWCGSVAENGHGIGYSTSINGPWTTKIIFPNRYKQVLSIHYINGYYIVTSDSEYAYTTDFTANWTTVSVSSLRSGYIYGIAYGNDYWVMSNQYGSIFYSKNIGGPWTKKDVLGGDSRSCFIRKIKFLNGSFVVCGYEYTESSGGSQYFATIAYQSNPTLNWTVHYLDSTSLSINIGMGLTDIEYANGVYVISGYEKKSGRLYVRAFTATSLSGSWTIHNLWSSTQAQGNTVLFDGANWIIAGHDYNSEAKTKFMKMSYSTNLGNWSTKDVTSMWEANVLFFSNLLYVAVYSNKLAYCDASKLQLPLITSDRTYNYIKVK